MEKTPLYDKHVALGGRMVEFAGYELPVQYPTGPMVEHNAVRTAAGLFDIDHMGQVEVSGPDADAFLQLLQPHNVDQLQPADAHYSYLLYEDGTFVDDIFLYKLPERWMVAINASNRAKDVSWMHSQALDFDVTIEDISDKTCMLALQGPAAEATLQKLADTDLGQVRTRTSIATTLDGTPALLGRTGYTGEDGFELYFPSERAAQLWDTLLEAGKEFGVLPCGLAARDSLRFEACMPLYGHEIDASINPLEARLGWVIDWNKYFIGRTALLKTKLEGAKRLLVGFEMIDKAVPREHYPVTVNGQPVGFVTTGMKSPTLDKFIGMAYVSKEFAEIGTALEIVVRGQSKKAAVIKRPFYKPKYK
ncbi:MAG: glycine cleavage system aminomethyltransferase GcvT [Caldilineaceae bacterium]